MAVCGLASQQKNLNLIELASKWLLCLSVKQTSSKDVLPETETESEPADSTEAAPSETPDASPFEGLKDFLMR